MPTATTQTLLLVEDEEDDIHFMKRALKSVGLLTDLQVAQDGATAIEYLAGRGVYADRARYPIPALVFLDLKLPRVMGLEVLRWIREQPDLDMMIVIVLTSSQLRSDIRTAYSLRANSYLVKPSNPLDLKGFVELVKRYWLDLNQPTSVGEKGK